MARTPEDKVEDYLVEQSAVYGALVRKLAYVGRRGAPDRMVVWGKRDFTGVLFRLSEPGKLVAHIDFVELKAKGQKADDHQAREHERLRALGCNVFLIDSKEAVDRYIAMRR